jgi:hypothetical protein
MYFFATLLPAAIFVFQHGVVINAFSPYSVASVAARSRHQLVIDQHKKPARQHQRPFCRFRSGVLVGAEEDARAAAACCRLLLQLGATPNDDNDDKSPPPSPSLIVHGEAMEQQMAILRSKYPTSESAYLAAARARNDAKIASREESASDRDWKDMQQQKQQAVGDIDDWAESAKEAGNIDSQILLPSLPEEDGDDDEPKLLLF